jgi:hypothetical protein
MRKLKSNFNRNSFPSMVDGGARLAYLSPEVEVQHVELENGLAVGSITTGPSDPNVTDWTDGGSTDTGDITLP